MKLMTFDKQPIEVKDYDIDYLDWLAPIGDRIVSVTCSVSDDPAGALAVDCSNYSSDAVKLWVSGGTNGSRYTVEITVTTAGGRIDQNELVFRIKEI
jgi:hypothetical protein